MKTEHYRAMLKAVEQALAICQESLGKMDASHRQICEDLRHARERLIKLIDSPDPKAT